MTAAPPLPPRSCLLHYEDNGGCALNARVPEGWSRLEPSYSLRFQLRALRFRLPSTGLSDPAILEIGYAPVGPPPPRIRGWRGTASPQMVEAQLQAWAREFLPDGRVLPAQRSGAFDVDAGSAVSVALAGTWAGRAADAGHRELHAASTRGERQRRPDYALLGAIVPARPAEEGQQQYAFFLRAVGPAEVLAAAAEPFAAFVRSARTDDAFLF